MRARVSIDKFRLLMAGLVLVGSTALHAASDQAVAGPKLRSIAAGTAATRVAANSASDDDKAKASDKTAATSADASAKDPLANLKISDQQKLYQERADRALAENGETRVDEEDADGAFAGDDDAKSQSTAAKPKSVTAGIKCVAGCY